MKTFQQKNDKEVSPKNSVIFNFKSHECLKFDKSAILIESYKDLQMKAIKNSSFFSYSVSYTLLKKIKSLENLSTVWLIATSDALRANILLRTN